MSDYKKDNVVELHKDGDGDQGSSSLDFEDVKPNPLPDQGQGQAGFAGESAGGKMDLLKGSPPGPEISTVHDVSGGSSIEISKSKVKKGQSPKPWKKINFGMGRRLTRSGPSVSKPSVRPSSTRRPRRACAQKQGSVGNAAANSGSSTSPGSPYPGQESIAEGDDKLYMCNACQLYNLGYHVRRHIYPTHFTCAYQNCQIGFRNLELCLYHELRVHGHGMDNVDLLRVIPLPTLLTPTRGFWAVRDALDDEQNKQIADHYSRDGPRITDLVLHVDCRKCRRSDSLGVGTLVKPS